LVGSDLSIITHNDLYGNLTTRRAASVVISTAYNHSTANLKCAALGTRLWDPDSYKQDYGYLQYLDYGRDVNETALY